MTRAGFLAGLVAIGGISIGAAGYTQQQGPRPEVREIQKVQDNLYFISGGDTYDRPTWTGGNVTVLVADSGVVLVDTMVAGSGRGILERVRSVTDKPVTMIINTHTHSDHSGSNTEFPATIEFVTHENTKSNMSKATCPPVTNCAAFKGDNVKYLPKRTFKDRLSLLSGRDRIELHYFGPGHTNGDTWVVFPSLRAMHTGDMFQRKNMPFVDTANNSGNAAEFNETLKKALSTINNVDTVIGGHTPTVVTWNDFREFTEFYEDFYRTVRDGVKAGRTPEEIAIAYQVPAKYRDYRADPDRVRSNAQSIHDHLTKAR
jgi:glyoxylase-like metal-dependent hydrolase (beta-lactamase superfamily II)